MTKKNTLIPRLRFPEFKNDGEWEEDIVDNLVSTVTPPKKLTSSSYQKSGNFPIIDQSKLFYCGWTNDADAVIFDNLPLIIFGDHTCILKIVNEPFVQGADGIKILKTESKIIPEFCYQYLQYNEVKQEEYKRHFSILKEKPVLFPSLPEQERIASCLSSLDNLIDAHSQKLDLLKEHKKGLMQNLFPREGEKVPRLRFPEFKNDGEWEEKKLSACIDYIQPTEYLVENTNYNDDYKTPVLTAGKSFILGYTDEKKGIYKEHLPVIIFDDFTTASKYVDFPFKVKSTAMKILTAKKNANVKFLFESMQLIKYEVGVHQRHWISIFSNLKIPIPSLPEQQRIASCLSSLDELIVAQTEKIEQLKEHKKGLMQGLFPGQGLER